VSAPVFTRIAQQVLEYWHVPHDTEIPASRQLLLARAKASDKDLEEGSPDHPGESIDEMETAPASTLEASNTVLDAAPARTHESGVNPPLGASVVQASVRQNDPTLATATRQTEAAPGSPSTPATGTVVLDVEQGGIVVPSFLGKSVRSSIELAENSGLELDVVGSGTGQDQSPAPGSHVINGSRITVKFGR
jgi:cell division protein FtsI (penicillin-binding protein 3)